MKNAKVGMLAADIAECAVFVALMTAGAYVTIPFPLVPLTFQTVISVLAGLMLGAKKGAASMLVYCLTGLIGIPVFSGGGGIFYVLKPSFGYVLGFVFSAIFAGLIGGRPGLPVWRYVVGGIAAFLADYAVGIPYCIVAAHLLGVKDLAGLLVTGNLLYMPKDLVLSVLAGLLAWRTLPVVTRARARIKDGR